MSQILRHVNGGAQKVGSEVHVSADSFCNADSVLRGESSVFHSTLWYARLKNCQIFNSSLRVVTGTGSVFAESEVQSVICENTVMDKVKAIGALNVLKGLILEPITLVDVVAENCELYGNWTLDGNARIPTGIWHRAPRYKRITGDNGVDIGLTESTDGYALMACWRKPITKWLRYGPRLGLKHNWTEKQINDARIFFEEILDVPMEGVTSNAA